MTVTQYDRARAIKYAKQWAYSRNPIYYDFSEIGGDCTNFASQCLFAGSNQMNFEPVFGWYYLSADRRTASWTGVEYLYNFLVANGSLGPFGEQVTADRVQIGDLIQLGRDNGDFYHTPVIVGMADGEPLVAAHSIDCYDRPLSTYNYARIRYIHISGVRIP